MGHIQPPQFHAATTMKAIFKHRHLIENETVKWDIEVKQGVSLLFAKDAARQGADKRSLTQACIAVSSGKGNPWAESEALQSGVLGPLPLIKVSDMQGYDPDSGAKPSPASRVEQILGHKKCLLLFSLSLKPLHTRSGVSTGSAS